MLAEQLDLSLENPGSHGDILPSKYRIVKGFCFHDPVRAQATCHAQGWPDR